MNSYSRQSMEIATQTVSDVTSIFTDDIMTILTDTVQNEENNNDLMIAKVNGEDNNCSVQTGIAFNLLSLSMLILLNLVGSFKPEAQKLCLLNDTVIDIIGTVSVTLKFNDVIHTIQFHIPPLIKTIAMLGREGLCQMIPNWHI